MLHRSRIAMLLVLWSSPLVAQDQDSLVTGKKPDLGKTARIIVEGTNSFRRDQGRAELKTSPRLEATARDFAAFMARTDKYGHDADGNHPEDRVKKHDYDYCIVAENIAYEFNSNGFTTADLAKRFVEGWKKSPGHRRNMVDADLTDLGVAVSHSDTSGKYYAVQVLGRPKSAEIEFRLINESGVKIKYHLDDEAETLEPGFTRGYKVCRPTTLKFAWTSAEGQSQSFTPARGDRFFITRKNGKLSVRKRTAATGR
jgi:uncharacterized protein YkwD